MRGIYAETFCARASFYFFDIFAFRQRHIIIFIIFFLRSSFSSLFTTLRKQFVFYIIFLLCKRPVFLSLAPSLCSLVALFQSLVSFIARTQIRRYAVVRWQCFFPKKIIVHTMFALRFYISQKYSYICIFVNMEYTAAVKTQHTKKIGMKKKQQQQKEKNSQKFGIVNTEHNMCMCSNRKKA